MAPTLEWKKEWSDPDYEWPVVAVPDGPTLDRVGETAVARGGRHMKEAHADRDIILDFPSAVSTGTYLRKQGPRAECRRRAQVMLPNAADDPLKVCVVCDSVHLWPTMAP